VSTGRLTREDLVGGTAFRRLRSDPILLDEVDSTNRYLLASDLPDGTIASAEFQTAGRGRRNRRWTAPRGSSLLISVRLHEPTDSPLLWSGGLLAALAACEAIEATTPCAPAVSWPNDVTIGGRKVAGVLVESTPLPAAGGPAQRAVVIGVGLNCLQHRGHFDPELAETATSLDLESARAVERGAVGRALLAALDQWICRAGKGPEGLAGAVTAWRERSDDFGRRAQLVENDRTYSGTIVALGERGELVVQLDAGGRRAFEPATTTRFR